jgi:hypothetical protein
MGFCGVRSIVIFGLKLVLLSFFISSLGGEVLAGKCDKRLAEISQPVQMIYTENRLAYKRGLGGMAGFSSAASAKLLSIANFLSASSGFATRIAGPDIVGELEILVVRGELGDIPRANFNLGVLLITDEMLRFVRSDDELAAVVGEQTLHQILGHDIERIETTESFLFRFLKRRSKFSSRPTSLFFDKFKLNWAGDVLQGWMDRKKIKQDREALLALPSLLQNSGYNPWAIVDFYERFLAKTQKAAPIFLDGYTRLTIQDRLKVLIEFLQKTGIPRSDRHHGRRLLDDVLSLLSSEATSLTAD